MKLVKNSFACSMYDIVAEFLHFPTKTRENADSVRQEHEKLFPYPPVCGTMTETQI